MAVVEKKEEFEVLASRTAAVEKGSVGSMSCQN
jgi:hypothetical protein